MTRTVDELLKEALDVQDACNLSGVVHSFSRAMTELRENGINSTQELNTHHVCVLYANKIAQLAEDGHFRFSAAYRDACEATERLKLISKSS